MQRLILMRHAKTEPWTEGIEDFGRALLPRGHDDAKLMADTLVAANWTPGQILISPARRTRETAAHVCAAFANERVRPVEALYLAGLSDIDAALATTDAETVMIIGHNPGIHDYALLLTDRGGAASDADRRLLFEKFPTSCAALFARPEDDAEAPLRLMDVLRVSELRPPA